MKFTIKSAIFSIVLLSFSVLLTSCSDSPSTYGLDDLGDNRGVIKVLDSKTDSLTQTSNNFKSTVALGSADYILLGNHSGIKSSILLKYDIILDSYLTSGIKADTLQLTSCRLLLTPTYKNGTDTTLAFGNSSVKGYKILNDWEPLSVKTDSLPTIETGVNQVTGTPMLDSIYRINISHDLAKQWLMAEIDTTTYKNYGIYLTTEAPTNYIFGFQAYSSLYLLYPQIQFTFHSVNSNYDTVYTFNSYADAHHIEGYPKPAQTNEVVIESGVIMESKVKFDISKLPKNIIVNNAKLTVTTDTLQRRIGKSSYDALRAYFISSVTNDSTVTPSSTVYANLYKDGANYTGDVTELINSILFENQNNGFLITPVNDINGVERFVFKGSNAAVDQRPRLTITYTTLKGSTNAK